MQTKPKATAWKGSRHWENRNKRGFIFFLAHFLLALLLHHTVFLSVIFSLYMWKHNINEFHFLPRLTILVIWGSSTQIHNGNADLNSGRLGQLMFPKNKACSWWIQARIDAVQDIRPELPQLAPSLLSLDHKHPKYVHNCKGHLTLDRKELPQSALSFETEIYNIP